MGERCTISGHIQETWYAPKSDKELRVLLARNKRVIESLPREDTWPFLVRGMFSFSPTANCNAKQATTTYRGRVIHFGGSFSKLYLDWDIWLNKFEGLLRQMYWEHVVVVHVTEIMGVFTHRWRATHQSLELFAAKPPIPVKAWDYEGGPRSFK